MRNVVNNSFIHLKIKAMKMNIQNSNDPGNGGCCGGGVTDWGCC